MKIFNLSKIEVEQIKKRQIALMIIGTVFGIAIIIIFLIIATRKTFILFLILSLITSLCVSVFFLYMLLGKLKSTNNYLLILKKSDNSKNEDVYTFVSHEADIFIKDGNSYLKYTFMKEDNYYAFYVLYNIELNLVPSCKYKLTYIDNILLELENINEKD